MHSMLLTPDKDPMGAAIIDYLAHGKASKLRVFSSMFDEDEIPVYQLFRTFQEMPSLEQKAGRFSCFPIIPEPFIKRRMVSNGPVKLLSKKFCKRASFTPRLFIASTERGDMSIAVTSLPISCKAKVWHPLPAPTSSILPVQS